MIFIKRLNAVQAVAEYDQSDYIFLIYNVLGKGTAQQIIHSTYFDLAQHKYLQINISDAFAKCLNVLLNLPKACVHARTHGKMVSLANKLCGMY